MMTVGATAKMKAASRCSQLHSFAPLCANFLQLHHFFGCNRSRTAVPNHLSLWKALEGYGSLRGSFSGFDPPPQLGCFPAPPLLACIAIQTRQAFVLRYAGKL